MRQQLKRCTRVGLSGDHALHYTQYLPMLLLPPPPQPPPPPPLLAPAVAAATTEATTTCRCRASCRGRAGTSWIV
jgi:hypothetical protein